MNFFKRPSSANIPDKILGEQERFLMGPVFVPLSEITTENEACANGPAPIVSTKPAPIDTHEVAPAVEANSDTAIASGQQSKLIQTCPYSNISYPIHTYLRFLVMRPQFHPQMLQRKHLCLVAKASSFARC